MKLTIEPTGRFFMAGEVMVRLWKGHSGGGQPVIALVSAVAFGEAATADELNLISIPSPHEADAAIWAHTVLARLGEDD